MKIRLLLIMAALIVFPALGTLTVAAGPLPGAIFTTTVNGSRVNANIYAAKEDVYLDGGPGPNAPISAAGLDEGYYFFQVTDPPGKTLLSTDAVKCRKFHVDGSGIIDSVVASTWLQKVRGRLQESDCTHITGTDIDHSAKTVQLMPYDNTPNNGGVYKVWVTPVEKYQGDPNEVDKSTAGFHGFLPSWSKTDNFKVKGRCPNPPTITVRKFDDCNYNGEQDDGEPEITGWPIELCDPLGVSNNWYSKVVQETLPAGVWIVCEATKPSNSDGKWRQTALIVDGAPMSLSPCVDVVVIGDCGESHDVVFGNVQLGKICGKKFYDRNGNGYLDEGEPGLAGIKLHLVGPDVDMYAVTGADGVACFSDELLPGTFTMYELLPCNNSDIWVPSTPTTVTFALGEGSTEIPEFGNYCIGTAAFGTKGYWHNKNGLQEIKDQDIAYVNTLTLNGKPGPYQAPSSYFETGDEPFNGKFQDGTDIAVVNGEWGEEIAPAGSAKAEISQFLVDSNATGDPREQLAQQLLAFIFNCRHRLGGQGATIVSPGGPIEAGELIKQAMTAWQGTDGVKQNEIKDILDRYNNCSEVKFIHGDPCPVSIAMVGAILILRHLRHCRGCGIL